MYHVYSKQHIIHIIIFCDILLYYIILQTFIRFIYNTEIGEYL